MSELLELMRTTRTVRRFVDRPIDDGILRELLTAATWAPSGSNSQPWGFLVVRDAARRRALRDLYLQRFTVAEQAYAAAAGGLSAAQARLMRGARHLAEHLDAAPVLLFPCVDKQRYPMIFDAHGAVRDPTTLFASILPAVQNLLLAARARGIGGCLTTILRFADDEVRALLAIPEHVVTTVMVPLGYASEPFTPVRRRDVAAVAYLDRWGAPLFGAP